MRVGVPIFGEEVSPRFGCCTELLVATVTPDRIVDEEIRDISGLTPLEVPEFVASLGITRLVCGGMHPQFLREFERWGIEVIWGVIGPAADALSALRDGELHPDVFVCRGRRGRHGRGARGSVPQGPSPGRREGRIAGKESGRGRRGSRRR